MNRKSEGCRQVTYHIIILGTEPSAPLAYAPVTELHRPIMSTLGGHGFWLERERVTDINRINQMLHLSTNVGSKTNQIQEMVQDYGKVWYDNNAISNIFLLANFVNKYRVTYESHQDDDFSFHTNRWIIKFRKKNKGCMSSSPHILHQNPMLSPQQKRIWWDS